MTEEQKNEIYQEYLEKGREICRRYREIEEAVYEKNEVNGRVIRDASVREVRELDKKKREELKQLAEIYRAKYNE